jgi:SOS-response transcriptional repressor LexA
MSLPRTQTELLAAIQSEIEDDGKAHNLFRIGVEIAGQDYSLAHYNLSELIQKGMVRVKRKRCLEIEILPSVPSVALEVEF